MIILRILLRYEYVNKRSKSRKENLYRDAWRWVNHSNCIHSLIKVAFTKIDFSIFSLLLIDCIIKKKTQMHIRSSRDHSSIYFATFHSFNFSSLYRFYFAFCSFCTHLFHSIDFSHSSNFSQHFQIVSSLSHRFQCLLFSSSREGSYQLANSTIRTEYEFSSFGIFLSCFVESL